MIVMMKFLIDLSNEMNNATADERQLLEQKMNEITTRFTTEES